MLSFPAPELIVVLLTVATMLSSPAVPVMVGLVGAVLRAMEIGSVAVADKPSWS